MRAPASPIRYDAKQRMSGLELLGHVPDESVALAFLDPQYREVLDEMAYGNEGARQKARAALPQTSTTMIALMVREIERVLRPSGHLALWIDKFSLGEAKHHRYFDKAEKIKRVDLITWDSLGFGMGVRSRSTSQFVVVCQKPPVRSKGIWTDKRLRDVWSEMSDKSIHPHAKPYQLTERIIRAVTKRGDLVIDPCAGGYGVLTACRSTGRRFLGCDLVTELD